MDMSPLKTMVGPKSRALQRGDPLNINLQRTKSSSDVTSVLERGCFHELLALGFCSRIQSCSISMNRWRAAPSAARAYECHQQIPGSRWRVTKPQVVEFMSVVHACFDRGVLRNLERYPIEKFTDPEIGNARKENSRCHLGPFLSDPLMKLSLVSRRFSVSEKKPVTAWRVGVRWSGGCLDGGALCRHEPEGMHRFATSFHMHMDQALHKSSNFGCAPAGHKLGRATPPRK